MKVDQFLLGRLVFERKTGLYAVVRTAALGNVTYKVYAYLSCDSRGNPYQVVVEEGELVDRFVSCLRQVV